MAVSDEAFANLESLVRKIQREKQVLEDTIERWRQNGLGDLDSGHGLQKFGSGNMRLDKNGIQLETPTPATGDVPAMYWVNEFSTDPASAEPRVELAGRADDSTVVAPNGIFSFKLRGKNAERFGMFYHAIGASGTNQIGMEIWNRTAAPGGAQPGLTISDSGSLIQFTLFGGDQVQITAMPLFLGQFTADPASLQDGGIWYRTDTDFFKGRRNSATKNFLMEGDVSGMNKVTGSGYLVHPAAASGIDPANSGVAWTNGAWSEVVASTAQAQSIVGMMFGWDSLLSNTLVEAEIDIGTGAAASEVAVATIPALRQPDRSGGGTEPNGAAEILPFFFPAPIEVASGVRVSVRLRSSSTTLEPDNIRLIYAKASELVAR